MYQRAVKGWAKHLDFYLVDLLCLGIAIGIEYFLRYGFSKSPEHAGVAGMIVMLEVIDFLIMLFMDSMEGVIRRGWYREMINVLNQAVLLFLCASAFIFLMQSGTSYSRVNVLFSCILYIPAGYAGRCIRKVMLRRNMVREKGNALLIMASASSAANIIREIHQHNYSSHHIVGVVVHDTSKIGISIEGVPAVASYDNVLSYILSNWVDEIMIAVNPTEEVPAALIENLMEMGVTVHLHMNTHIDSLPGKQVASKIGGLLVISNSTNYITPRQAIAKRALDICGALVGCLITGIAYLYVAPRIKKESPGPVFFTQTRIGRNGKPFKMYKFRSMYPDAEQRKKDLMEQNKMSGNLMFKMDFDPRIIGNKIDEKGNQITGIGQKIRSSSIDELPQFFNVLKGDMSLVGTRPPLVEEVEHYKSHYKARLAIKPGITGLWQVSGRSDILDFDEVLKLDTEYINNWSIGMDLRILLKTVKVVFKKEGSV